MPWGGGLQSGASNWYLGTGLRHWGVRAGWVTVRGAVTAPSCSAPSFHLVFMCLSTSSSVAPGYTISTAFIRRVGVICPGARSASMSLSCKMRPFDISARSLSAFSGFSALRPSRRPIVWAFLCLISGGLLGCA